MSQYYAETLVKFRLCVPLMITVVAMGAAFIITRCSNRTTAYRRMDEARKSVIENTAGIQSLFIYLRIIILRYQLQATRLEKASEVVSGNRASAVR